MTDRIKYAKSRGYYCGINILSTIGHHNKNLGNSLSGDITRMTNINGETCQGWSYVQDSLKSTQLKRIFRWLSKDSLPAYVESFCRIYNWTRILRNGCTAIALINASLDDINDIYLCVKTKKKSLIINDMNCEKKL